MSNGNHKGSAYERWASVSLSNWLSGGLRDDLLWRSAGSGSRATVKSRHQKAQQYRPRADAGDLVGTDVLGCMFTRLFFVECKHYKDMMIGAWVHGHKGWLERQVLKPFTDAENNNRVPFVLCRENRRKDLILTSSGGRRMMKWASDDRLCHRMQFFHEGIEVYVYHYTMFIEMCKWARLHTKCAAEGLFD